MPPTRTIAQRRGLLPGEVVASDPASNSSTDASKTSASAGSSGSGSANGATSIATAGATLNTQAMVQSSNSTATVLLTDSSSLVYTCPGANTWTSNNQEGNQVASEVTGAGCSVQLTFEGDSVQAFGGTASDAGVFGCSVDSKPRWTGWWDAESTANWFSAYGGSCLLEGLGWGTHTFTMINSPYKPGKMYFTGIMYTTNQSQQEWSSPTVAGCCASYSFPSGAVTTIPASSSASGTNAATGTSTAISSTTTSSDTMTYVVFALAGLALTALAALLVGCMCCRKREPAPDSDPLAGLDEKVPLRKKSRKHKKGRRGRSSSSVSSGSLSSESSTGSSSWGYKSSRKGKSRGRGKTSEE